MMEFDSDNDGIVISPRFKSGVARGFRIKAARRGIALRRYSRRCGAIIRIHDDVR
jgi:hypothetical protein